MQHEKTPHPPQKKDRIIAESSSKSWQMHRQCLALLAGALREAPAVHEMSKGTQCMRAKCADKKTPRPANVWARRILSFHGQGHRKSVSTVCGKVLACANIAVPACCNICARDNLAVSEA
jgi:hypothetical protein